MYSVKAVKAEKSIYLHVEVRSSIRQPNNNPPPGASKQYTTQPSPPSAHTLQLLLCPSPWPKPRQCIQNNIFRPGNIHGRAWFIRSGERAGPIRR